MFRSLYRIDLQPCSPDRDRSRAPKSRRLVSRFHGLFVASQTRMPRAEPLKDIIMGATHPVIMLVLIRSGLEGIAQASQ